MKSKSSIFSIYIASLLFLSVSCNNFLDKYGDIDVADPIIASALTDGLHTLVVTGSDSDGNRQSEESATQCNWTVDMSGPVVVLSNTPSAVTNITDINIIVSGDQIVCYRNNLDGEGWSDIIDVNYPILDSDLAESTHSLHVIGCDLTGKAKIMRPNIPGISFIYIIPGL